MQVPPQAIALANASHKVGRVGGGKYCSITHRKGKGVNREATNSAELVPMGRNDLSTQKAVR